MMWNRESNKKISYRYPPWENCYSHSLLFFRQVDGTYVYHAETSNLYLKVHALYALTYKWILPIQYRIPIQNSTDPKKLNMKEGTRKDT